MPIATKGLYGLPSYEAIAGLYDLDMAANNSGRDIEFYCELARRACGPVLELGCGTGRISLALAGAGTTVVGLDNSVGMLRHFRFKRRASRGDVRRRTRLVHADMRDFDLGQQFALIICPFSAFTYLVTDEDVQRCLGCVRRHLLPRGLFALDVFVPAIPPDGSLVHDYRREQPGFWSERSKRIERVDERTNRITRYYRFGGEPSERATEFSTEEIIRWYTPESMAECLAANGFEVVSTSFDFAAAFVARPTGVY